MIMWANDITEVYGDWLLQSLFLSSVFLSRSFIFSLNFITSPLLASISSIRSTFTCSCCLYFLHFPFIFVSFCPFLTSLPLAFLSAVSPLVSAFNYGCVNFLAPQHCLSCRLKECSQV